MRGEFLGPNWLLTTKEAVWLYHDVALPFRKSCGIVDVHTHLSLRQICENDSLLNIWKAEVVDERYGNRDHYLVQLAAKFPPFSFDLAYGSSFSDFEKWMVLSEVFPYLEGNHVYQWMHLDLQRVFGIFELLGPDTGKMIWEITEEALAQETMRPQELLRKMGGRLFATTDDPLDSLEDHKKARETFSDIVFIPTFRPDAYVNIADPHWRENVEKICSVTGEDTTLHGLVRALRKRHAYFVEMGARASDHGLLEPFGLKVSESRAEDIFVRAYVEKERFALRSPEVRDFISYMMHHFFEMDHDADMVTQIHFGVFRDANEYLFARFGANVGGDVTLDSIQVVENLRPLISRFCSGCNNTHRLVLYTMNPEYLHVLVALARAFPGVYIGFPWWFNDAPHMIEQALLEIANSALLTSVAGPVADGRKILSEGSRFEVFDRMICRVVGKLLAEGQVSRQGAVRLVEALMCRNAVRIFKLQIAERRP
ncbi:glucuronate isomerase [Candidatus Caldatribacterium sp.]|uniref:glucuronate isomerase n=1 Tax=Candidatus Caldatribacterium sp. TaxID=2282143 RepID=UPI0029982EEA|nr:glucuronate isomerase [Candidatus Caldatribacterium sp.]MDW8081457.1 glucuronate isomerase [Candidatus Calescibacterium sp.]